MLGNDGKRVILSSFQGINFTWVTSILQFQLENGLPCYKKHSTHLHTTAHGKMSWLAFI